MNYETLKASIMAVIKANGNEEITGPILQQTLLAIVNALGTGYQFLGIANSNTELGTPDQRVFYVAYAAGISITIGSFDIEDEICILKYADSWTKETLFSIDTSVSDDSDNLVTSGAVASAIESALTQIENAYAKKDGIYPDLVAGSAQSLLNPVALAGSFVFRPTGGGADIGKGKAIFSQLHGKSLVWNQLAQNGNFADGTANWFATPNASISVADGECTITSTGTLTGARQILTTPVVAGHKYIIRASVKGASGGEAARIGVQSTGITISETATTSYAEYSGVFTANNNGTVLEISTTGGSIVAKDVFLIDLTLMFGTGNEPATVADFQKDFPLPYYAYNAGKVIPFAAQDYEAVGFNHWDEEWEVGDLNASTGAEVSANDRIRNKGYIPVLSGTNYYCNNNSIAYYIFYDANKAFISNAGGVGVGGSNNFTTPVNAAYMRFYCLPAYGTTYNHDICINLSGPRNGEYEPYKKITLHFNPAGWVDPSDNDIYPYGGMHGVGSAYDFAKVDADGYIRKATRTFVRVDLGSLNWGVSGTAHVFFCANFVPNNGAAYGPNLICGKYLGVAPTYRESIGDKMISYDAYSKVILYVRDDAYSDAATFKAAMSGVYLIFQLATPIESTLDDPVKAYADVDGSGTEAWKPDNTTDPYTTPCDVSIFYPLDIAGGVISAQSFANFCSELSTKLGAALNKTISIAATYNAATEQYGYTITIS